MTHNLAPKVLGGDVRTQADPEWLLVGMRGRRPSQYGLFVLVSTVYENMDLYWSNCIPNLKSEIQLYIEPTLTKAIITCPKFFLFLFELLLLIKLFTVAKPEINLKNSTKKRPTMFSSKI